jgi:streptogramin lyase
MSGVLAAGVLVVGWVGGVPAGAAAPVVTTYTNPSISGPQGITTGSDGAVWFTNEDSDSIGRVTTAGTVTNYTDSTISSPPDITAGPDGALWFTNFDDSIGRITTAGAVTNYTGPGISDPVGIAAGPDGDLWFANNGNNSIGRITTAGTVTNYTGPGISGPADIAAGSDGALWFLNDGNDSIGRITTAGTVTNYTGPGISDPVGIAAGPDGALWFTNNTNSSIGRITTAGTVTNYRDAHISGPGGIIAGPDHALWFTNFTNSSIGRITTAGTVTDYTDPSIASPADITVGADDALWFANFNNSSIGRITTPATPLLAPNPPTAVRATSDATTRGSGAVTVSYRAGAARGTTVTRFTATCTSNDGGATRNGVHNGPTSTSITVGGLNTKRIYRCRVGATSAQGTSPPSALSNTVTVGAPGLPRPPRVVRVGAGHVKVSFTAPASNGAPIIAVKAVCRSSNGGVTKAKTGTAGPLGVKGLTAAKSYTCTVTATNRRGTGPTSVPSAPVTA